RPGTAVRCALWTGGIEEVNVRVDDGNRRRLRLGGPRHRGGSGGGRDAREEGSPRRPLLHRVLLRESFTIRGRLFLCTLALTKRCAPAMRSRSASTRTRDSRTRTHG